MKIHDRKELHIIPWGKWMNIAVGGIIRFFGIILLMSIEPSNMG